MREILQQTWRRSVPESVRNTLWLQAFGLTKVPMLFFCMPRVVALDDAQCAIRIPLNRRTRNHVGSMYFAALCAGADCAAGLLAYRWAESQEGVSAPLVFKEVHGEFMKRAEGDVVFTCNDGALVAEQLGKALRDGTRVNIPVEIVATCPEKSGDEPVARFRLTLSAKPKRG